MISALAPEVKDLLGKIYCSSRRSKITLYLVGGYLRDMIQGRKKLNPDIDFSLIKGALNFGRKLSRQLQAGFVVLDKERGCCRLVKKIKGKVITLDFTDFRGPTLEKDLLHRDFTINAFAVELGKINNLPLPIIDPYAGREDLQLKTIRYVNKKGFDDDPLRILRAFSLAAIFKFKIDKATLRLIKEKRRKLSLVSYERIRDELFKIFAVEDSFAIIEQLDKLKILKIILPEIEAMRGLAQGPYHHLDVWKHTLEALRQLEILMPELKNNRDIQNYLNEVISSEHKRYALIKLGALLHDIGKPKAKRREGRKIKFHGHERIGAHIARDIVKRLRLSNDEWDALEKMVFWHLRPGYLADNEEITPRATFRYFRDAAQEAVSILLLSLADQRATRGRLTCRKGRRHHEQVALDLIKQYFKSQKEHKPKRLINGNDLLKKFKLEPSPLIGKVLREIEELQAIGKIKTKPQAVIIAKKIIRKHAESRRD